MDGLILEDPFLWDVAAVVSDLCADGQPWVLSKETLQEAILEEEMDGETLLTYEYHFSRKELMESLRIKPARCKAALASRILALQAKSAAFKRWKKIHDQNTAVISRNSPARDLPAHEQPASGQSLGSTLPTRNESTLIAAGKPEQNSLSESGQTYSRDEGRLPDSGPAETLIGEQIGQSPPPTKRRRVAPLHLADQPVNAAPALIPTEADTLTYGLQSVSQSASDSRARPWDTASPAAYYGVGGLTDLAICSSDNDTLSSRFIVLNEDDFAVPNTKPLPPGLSIAVLRILKKVFRANSRREQFLEQGIALSETTEETELGLDDLPEEFDEETMAEIEAEAAEREELAKAQARRFLSSEQVQQVLDEVVDQVEERWRQVKRPRHARKAHKLWTAASRRGLRNHRISEAQRQANHLESRVQRLCLEIHDSQWTKESEVANQAKCLEQSVEDKMYNLWLMELYQGRQEPPKPEALPRPKQLHPQRKRRLIIDDEEVLTSSEEDDFIVADSDGDVPMDNDKEAERIGLDELELPAEPDKGYASGVKSELEEPCECVDLTNVATPKKLKETRASIDLTSPAASQTPATELATSVPPSSSHTKDAAFKDPESLEKYSQVEEIGKRPWHQWRDEDDRYRLTVWGFWKLPHARREPVFQLLQRDTATVAFEKTVKAHVRQPLSNLEELEGPSKAETVAFDVTRLYMSFLKCKSLKPTRVAKIIKRDRDLLHSASSRFIQFQDFVNGVAEFFPKSEQIWDADAIDKELGDDEADPNDPAQDTPSKRRRKDIFQNKDAIDFRAREQQRAEEQETRRRQLRERLQKSGEIAHDKSRLIINDTKEEKHEVVYVDDHIAKDIKDHQIDGVKFMWNQVLANQGCLLAHTMGLGKTMQVITLLMAIAGTSQSSHGPTMVEQIPEPLRKSQTLVLCTAGLVDNWMDEFLMWSSHGVLGPLRKLDSSLGAPERTSIVQAWAQTGGILVIGYDMFKRMVQEEEMETVLTDSPSIVVADEAHNMKNPKAQLTKLCASFRTRCRIALTGSPLANNVEEYHAMIDWVAPNFLGPLSEFREIYAHPIQQGLYKDSSSYDKRKALKMLEVLKETVAPKMHRATMKCLRSDLPPKHEFVISLLPTEEQLSLYNLYIQGLGQELGINSSTEQKQLPQHRLFTVMNHLSLICNHPTVFRSKALEVLSEVQNGETLSFPPNIIERTLEQTRGASTDPRLSSKVQYLLLILDEARKENEKVLVFSQSIRTLNYLEVILSSQNRRVARLDGSTAIAKRQDSTKDFNSGDLQVFLISTKAGGVGLNIQAANRVVIFDSKWNPVDDQQAIGRAWRIRQTRPVYVYRLVVAGSFEEDLQNKSVFKTQLASRVVDKKKPMSWAKRSSNFVHPIHEVARVDTTPLQGKDFILDKLINHREEGGGGEGVVRSIVETDIFEEEDPTEILTLEDKKEAKDMADMHRLRFSNPAEYNRRRAEEQARLLAMSTGEHSRRPPYPVPASIPATSQATPPQPRPMNGQHPYAGSSALPVGHRQAPSQSHVPSQMQGTTASEAYPRQGIPQQPTTGPVNVSQAAPLSDAAGVQHTSESPREEGLSRTPINRTMDGAADTPILIDSDSERPGRGGPNPLRSMYRLSKMRHPPEILTTFTSSAPAPLPITGAGTFIGSPSSASSSSPFPPLFSSNAPITPSHTPVLHSNGPYVTPSPASDLVLRSNAPAPDLVLRSNAPPTITSSPSSGAALGSAGQPFLLAQSESTAKNSFQERLTTQLALLMKTELLQDKVTDAPAASETIVLEIHRHRENARQGFLPDNLHWKFLLEKLENHRFTAILAIRHWPSGFIALASRDEIDQRFSVLNSLSINEFHHELLGIRVPSTNQHEHAATRLFYADGAALKKLKGWQSVGDVGKAATKASPDNLNDNAGTTGIGASDASDENGQNGVGCVEKGNEDVGGGGTEGDNKGGRSGGGDSGTRPRLEDDSGDDSDSSCSSTARMDMSDEGGDGNGPDSWAVFMTNVREKVRQHCVQQGLYYVVEGKQGTIYHEDPAGAGWKA